MGLKEYKAKRDFSETAEPAGGKPLPKAVKGASRFVIQKHDATRLHYDFRLEMEGVLKSWAVPKGLPWAKGAKHLAVEVEDHPIEYASFEGVIPQGQYGGGTVMLWDRGTYHVFGEDPLKSLREGKLHFVLQGEKAKGEWTLVGTRMEAGKPQWLLLKTGESLPQISKKLDDQSVVSERTMKQIANQRDAEWQSNREEKKKPIGKRKMARARTPKAFSLPENLPAARPRFIAPMKPRLVDEPPASGDWIYELKFDGIRLIAVKNREYVNLISRNGNELASRFSEIAGAIRSLPIEDCVIDGEVVAMDNEGRSSFQLLQGRELPGGKTHPVYYYVFDLLQASGRSLIHAPLEARKAWLEQLCAGTIESIRYSGEIGGNAKQLLAEVKRRGLEGLIGKQRCSIYEPDRRSGLWIKLKCLNEQEFVIGGYTPPAGARKYFGAVLVGYYA
ncbi:MAG: DNA polymerase ligase N-terminal domain-containing protein, partial [Chthoniobacterales bacterium]